MPPQTRQQVVLFITPSPVLNKGLLQQAAAELAESGFARTVTLEDLLARPATRPLLVVDGDMEQTGRLIIEGNKIAYDFHLVLSDLGLEVENTESFSAQDIQLVKDAIEAACTVTNGPTPKFNCPCSGG